jgi:GT2 family glycosyltransferase
MKARPEVSVLIASHARPETLARVLASVERQRRDLILEVIVVDNKSARSSEVARVAGSFAQVTHLPLTENLGFGRALNRAFAHARGELTYFTCDDIVLGDGCLRHLCDAHRSRPRPGFTSLLLHKSAPPNEIQWAGGIFEFGLTPRLTQLRALPPSAVADGRPYPVSFVAGGLFMVERTFFARLGGYREDFFMYEEDTELSQRVLRSGRDLVIVPSAIAYDLCPPATFDPSRVNADKIRNFLAVILLHAPDRLWPLILAKQFIAGLRRLVRMPQDQRSNLYRGWTKFLASWTMLLRDRRLLVRQMATLRRESV